MNRRNFIKNSSLAGSGLYLSGFQACNGQPSAAAGRSSRVVIAQNDAVRNQANSLNEQIVGALLNDAMERYFESQSDQAWQQLFSVRDTVGIKINCLAGKGLSTSHELVNAIIENLQRAGVKKQNIIVWDRANRDLEKAGYPIQTSSRNVRYYGNDQAGYHNELFVAGEIGSLLSNIIVKQCTAIINLPILKDHGIVGMTNALKNFFGAIHNPNKYHSNAGDPFIADIHMIPVLRNKIRLTISDILTSQYEGGPPFMPQWTWPYNGIMVSQDMVALDAVGWQIIETKRREEGLKPLQAVGREPTYIATAADALHRIGQNNLSKIDVIRI